MMAKTKTDLVFPLGTLIKYRHGGANRKDFWIIIGRQKGRRYATAILLRDATGRWTPPHELGTRTNNYIHEGSWEPMPEGWTPDA
jgi:hypothetical protein